jgi:hypothetical protein
LADNHLGADAREADLSVQPSSVVVAKEHCERWAEVPRFGEPGLYDFAPQPAAAVLRVDDHTAEPHDLKTLALHLDLNDHYSGAGNKPAPTVAKADVSVFGAELQGDPSRVEWVCLVPFEFAPVHFCEGSELDDLHVFMQPKRSGRTTKPPEDLTEG